MISGKFSLDDDWKHIDLDHEQGYYIDFQRKLMGYPPLKNPIKNTSLHYIKHGNTKVLQLVAKSISSMQQLKNLGNAIGMSILVDFNWNRVKKLLDCLFKTVSRKQKDTIVCSMLQPWDTIYSNSYDHTNRIWFKHKYPEKYRILTNIPKYLATQVQDIRQCKDYDMLDWNSL